MKFKNIFYKLVLVYLIFFASRGLAQQESIYSQYMFNRVVVNPAYAGTKGLVSLTALYRYQWDNFDGSPNTFSISGHGASQNMKHGFGAFGVYDEHGAMTNSVFGVDYAYKIRFKKYTYLSFGLQAGLIQWSLNGKDIKTWEPDDPVFPNETQSVMQPDFGFGVFFNTRNFYVGASIAHLIEFDMNISGMDESEAKLSRHHFLTAGYDISLNKTNDYILTPSVFFRGVKGSDIQADLNLNLMMIQKFWIGMSYRTDDAVVFLAGVYPHKRLRIGYSYDLTTSDLSPYNDGTHEIMLSYDFGNPNKVRVVTPRYF